MLADDLRDVVVSSDGYWVSRFKSAQLLFVDSTTGLVGEPRAAATIEPPAGTPTNADGSFASVPGQFDSRVLSRLVSSTDGNIVLQHHHQNRGQLVSAYYGRTSNSTGGIAHGAVSTFVVATQSFVPLGATPNAQIYDLATSRDGTHLAAIATDLYGSTVYDTETSGRSELGPVEIGTWTETPIEGQASAVAFDGQGRTLVQVREPAALEIVGVTRIVLSDDSRYDTGHVLFHASTPTGVACATCHPEGGEDGMTWDFGPFGFRQTAPLNTGIMETFPLHWQGELPTIAEVMAETFVSRMGGPAPSPAQAQALGLWLQALSLTVAEESSMDDPAKRGRDVFVQLRCDACHSGARLTDNLNHDVGTGAEFQTPPLVGLRYSSPYMRDGCAATLWERFDPACGGPQHGDTSLLDEQELSDLVRYLEAL
jgi:mono/diheme cytochrome c family protein